MQTYRVLLTHANGSFQLQADLASTNAAVKIAATHLMATCHRQLGPDLAAMIRNNVKPALMTALEDAFKKNPKTQVQTWSIT